MKKTLAVTATASLVLLATVTTAAAQSARDHLRVVGSSTVYPFSTAVAEQFGKTTRFKTPVVESTGTGGGLKLFCSGIGTGHPDIANASRRIKASEVEACGKNGVTEIVEVKIGYDGIVLANAKVAPPMAVSRQQIFLALAKQVPKDGKLVDNPYKTWKDIDPSLPTTTIEVLGPPPTSGTRDAFVELVMDSGCEHFPELKALEKTDKKAFQAACQTVREDGAFIEAGENDNLIVQKLEANKNAFGIFGFSFLDQNADKLQGSIIDGNPPTFENIADGKYSVSRPLYIYVKKGHIGTVPGIREFLTEFTSDKASGPDGYLADKGLIPLPDAERKSVREKTSNLVNLSL